MRYKQKPKCLDCGKQLTRFSSIRCTKHSNIHAYKQMYKNRQKPKPNPDNINGLWRYQLI